MKPILTMVSSFLLLFWFSFRIDVKDVTFSLSVPKETTIL